MSVSVHATNRFFLSSCRWKHQKKLFSILNNMQYSSPKKGLTQQMKQCAVRLRRRAGGSPSLWEEAILLEAVIIIKFLVLVCSLVNFFYKERQMQLAWLLLMVNYFCFIIVQVNTKCTYQHNCIVCFSKKYTCYDIYKCVCACILGKMIKKLFVFNI